MRSLSLVSVAKESYYNFNQCMLIFGCTEGELACLFACLTSENEEFFALKARRVTARSRGCCRQRTEAETAEVFAT